MDVREFVSETLQQIHQGILDAQENDNPSQKVHLDFRENRQKVSFDIAVTVVEGSESGAKAGISVWSIGAGVTGKTESSTSIVSRIKFVVPMFLRSPGQD